MSNYSEQVKNIINQMSYYRLFVASELKKEFLDEVPEMTYYKTLERMVTKKELIHLAKGVYYKPEINKGEVILISDECIREHYISDNNGLLIGEQMLLRKGIISEASEITNILSKNIKEDKKRVGNVIIHKTDLVLNKDTIPVIETLEILQGYAKTSRINKNQFLNYMRNFSEQYSDANVEYVIESRKYKKSTIAFLERILNWYGVENSLRKYLSPLSEYKIPSIEELQGSVPATIQKYLDEYVLKIKDIYKDYLNQVILYGSYARGDYSEESDIDIMILLRMPELDLKEYRHELSQLTYDTNCAYGIDIKPIVKSKEEFEKWQNAYPLYQNIKREGVILFGAA